MIPSESYRWLASLPDNVADPFEAFVEIDKAEYTGPHADLLRNPWQGHIIKQEFPKKMPWLAEIMEEEFKIASQHWLEASDKEWNEVNLHEATKMIIAQVASRFTVGIPLCMFTRDTLPC